MSLSIPQTGQNEPDQVIGRNKSRGKIANSKAQAQTVETTHLPADAGILVIGEVIADPAVNLTEGHLLGWRGVDGIGDEGGVAVAWLAILVDCCFIFAEGGVRIRGRAWGTLSAAPWRHSLGSAPQLLNTSSESQLGQPVYGGEAAL